MRGLLEEAVERGTTPGGVLSFGDLRWEELIPFGCTMPGGPAVTGDTIYDIASLTKVVATCAVMMRLVADGAVALDANLGSLVPEVAMPGGDAITLEHLLGHSAGLPAHVPFYHQLVQLPAARSPRDQLLAMAATTPLNHSPGAAVLYSDIDFMLLGFALERATGRRLDALFTAMIADPIGMSRTRFVDLLDHPVAELAGAVAPSEQCPRRGLLLGQVHDDNAHAAGGIVGHAGLFSTAPDLARFARALLTAKDDDRFFSAAVVDHFWTTPALPRSSWRLGWDTPSEQPGVSHAGELWSRQGVGHLGFTGCSLWIDPGTNRYAILLTNSVYPTRGRTGIKELRRAVMDKVVRELDARAQAKR